MGDEQKNSNLQLTLLWDTGDTTLGELRYFIEILKDHPDDFELIREYNEQGDPVGWTTFLTQHGRQT